MKAKIKATIITTMLIALFVLTGFAVYLYPDTSTVILIGFSSVATVVSTWKIVYLFIDKD